LNTRKPSNAKVSARQQCVYEGPYSSEEIYGKTNAVHKMLKSTFSGLPVQRFADASFV